MLDSLEEDGYETPEFGSQTPTFGTELSRLARGAVQHFGAGEVLFRATEEWPRFPVCVLKDLVSEAIRVGGRT